ncbi:hypothetical protein [Candidatus Cetobacterium colombiensis]|uniref:Uncharacterized protein n=1 Tax=Candidatus Cetobacterium colombiensis TaxID=3073100 RepID=A0ABU4WFZ1_9FUSO|nr:hypothetical protein [Candidatus Cetobacterium colombiensis]MDX8337476.1 hypothetical protein [Candidatus Cetobacterium colombiensis]
MNVLENLRSLGEQSVNGILESFKIKSTGNFEQDTINLKNFYFENPETLYNTLPLGTYEFLEIALGDCCEEDYKHEFEQIACTFEDLGLSNTTVSDLVNKEVFLLNRYIMETNNYPPFSGKIAEEFRNILIENDFNPDEKIGKKTFEAVDKEIGTVLLNLLKENKEILENEKFNLNLLDKILKVHNYLSMDETFKIFNKLKINCDLNKLTTLVHSKFDYIYEEDDTILLFHKDNCKKVLSGNPLEYVPLTEIYSLETYLQA